MFGKRLSSFDIFSKVDSSYKKQTEQGGILSIVVASVLVFLFLSELYEYLQIHHKYEFLVDNSVQGKLELTLDMTVATKCKYLAVILVDNGGLVEDASRYFKFTEASIDLTDTSELGKDMKNDLHINNIIMNANKKAAGWGLLGLGSSMFSEKDSCRIHGTATLNKVSGKLFINVLGHGNYGPHVDHNSINLTHHITHLQFGKDYPGLKNPIDGLTKVASLSFATFDYYLSVVPTIYMDRFRNVLLTNQFAVTEHSAEYESADTAATRSTPGIYLNYDLEPISVRVSESNPISFVSFITRIFAIMGGIWSLVEFMYRAYLKVASLSPMK